MMETHKNMFVYILIITLSIMIGCILFWQNTIIYNILLALLGSSTIALFLEYLNYINEKRNLIMKIIYDNYFITNHIDDTLWIVDTAYNVKIKVDQLIELYQKTQDNLFILSKECYAPLNCKDNLMKTVEANAVVMKEIYDILLNMHRTIVQMRYGFELVPLKNNKKKNKSIDIVLDELIIATLEEKMTILREKTNEIYGYNDIYKEKYDLTDLIKVKSHIETVEDISQEFDAKNNVKTSNN